jgi:hypothetical protein
MLANRKKTTVVKWILLLATLCLPVWAWADESAFEDAVALWLEGNDAESLPQLATLAQGGHADARILLAQIEVKDRGHSPFRAGLIPAEARAIFRKDAGYGGFSKSWLAIEAQAGNPLAVALLNTRHPRPDPVLISTLHSLGEFQAKDYPIRMVALYGTLGQKEVLSGSDYMLDELRPYLEYHMDPKEPHGDGTAALRHMAPFANDMINNAEMEPDGISGVLALGYAFGDTSSENPWRGLVEDWIMTAPAARPIADLCRAQCASEVTGCGFAMLALSGGYFEVVRLDTPVESIIAQDRFLASPRARLMTLRRSALAKHNANRGWLATAEEVSEISVCAADLITRTRAEYE